MQLDAQSFLTLCEKAHALCFFDIEATGLSGDYNSVLTVSIKPYGQRALVRSVTQPGKDQNLVVWARGVLGQYACWVSYYGKGFDVPMLQSRLLVYKEAPLIKRHHVDMYFHLNAHIRTARKSQAHRIEWLGVREKKLTLSPDEWNAVLRNPRVGLKVMERRCRQDTEGLSGLYRRTRHLIGEVTR